LKYKKASDTVKLQDKTEDKRTFMQLLLSYMRERLPVAVTVNLASDTEFKHTLCWTTLIVGAGSTTCTDRLA